MHPVIDASEGDINISPERARWQREHLSHETRFWLKRDAQVFLHQSLSTPCLNMLEGCSGTTIKDREGRHYLDFHGNSVHQVGFSHPKIVEAIKSQLDTLSFCTRRYTNRPAIELAERLGKRAPGRLSKVLFAPGGTTAVGMALKLARLATGRHKTISMWDSFHGASLDAISVGGEALFRKGMGPMMPGSQHVPPADPYRCMWKDDGDCAACDLKCARFVEYVLEKEGDVGAVIAEPLRCTTATPPPPGYWQHIKKACHRHGALLIFDETAVCLGRTGDLFACQTIGVEPDILILGKGLGGGILPLAAIIAGDHLDIACETALGHYTHEKNPVLCAAALATLDVIEEENLLENAKAMGKCAMAHLETLQKKHPIVGDIRGLGLLFGAELTHPATREKNNRAAEKVMYTCLSLGLNFKVSQGNFLTLTPPLTITRPELGRAFDILNHALGIPD